MLRTRFISGGRWLGLSGQVNPAVGAQSVLGRCVPDETTAAPSPELGRRSGKALGLPQLLQGWRLVLSRQNFATPRLALVGHLCPDNTPSQSLTFPFHLRASMLKLTGRAIL